MKINERGWAGPADCNVSMPLSAWFSPPEVQWNHIDGPVLHWRGQMHWLTRVERIKLALKRTTLQEIAERRLG